MRTAALARHVAFAFGVLVAGGRVLAQVENGSFETGDLTGWTEADIEDPHVDLQVTDEGLSDGLLSLESEPTDGEFSLVTGFDGAGPGLITLAQDIAIPTTSSQLLLDFSTEWNLVDFAESTMDRTFSIIVSQEGGGDELASFEVLRVPFATVGSLLDVTSALSLKDYAGQTVNVMLAWDVPEDFSGPAFFDLDNLRLAGKKVPSADATSLKFKLNLLQENSKDTIKLTLKVPVGDLFDPDGAEVSVTIGDLATDFTLDAQGHGEVEGGTIKVVPDSANPELRKVTVSLKAGDFLGDLESFGVEDVDTPKGGVTALVPVSVDMDEVTTSEEILVVYKAKEGGTGTASGKTWPESLPGKLDIKLDFATPDSDKITLKTSAFTLPAFAPEGEEVSLDIGSYQRVFTLDAAGHAEEDGDSLTLKRDTKNPERQVVNFKCSARDVQSAMEADGLVDSDVAKPGEVVVVPVTIQVGGRTTRLMVSLTYTATAGVSGHAVGKL